MYDAVPTIRSIIDQVVAKRDQRRDGFARVIKNAMDTSLGDDAEDVLKLLSDRGISRALAREALDIAKQQGAFTIFSLVEALTRINGRQAYAGDRSEADAKASRLLAMAMN